MVIAVYRICRNRLMVGFFLPGDSLLFVAGIYSTKLVATFPTGSTGSDFIDLIILWILISVCGILGNMAGYWFGKKSGPFLFTRKDTFFLNANTCCGQKIFMISMVARRSYLQGSAHHQNVCAHCCRHCANGEEEIYAIQYHWLLPGCSVCCLPVITCKSFSCVNLILI